MAHLTPPRLMTRTCSLMLMLGEVLVTPWEGSMRLRSRGWRPFARSKSRRLTYIRLVFPKVFSLSIYRALQTHVCAGLLPREKHLLCTSTWSQHTARHQEVSADGSSTRWGLPRRLIYPQMQLSGLARP